MSNTGAEVERLRDALHRIQAMSAHFRGNITFKSITQIALNALATDALPQPPSEAKP